MNTRTQYIHIYNAESIDFANLKNLLFLHKNASKDCIKINGVYQPVYRIDFIDEKYIVNYEYIYKNGKTSSYPEIINLFNKWDTSEKFRDFFSSGQWERIFEKYLVICIDI